VKVTAAPGHLFAPHQTTRTKKNHTAAPKRDIARHITKNRGLAYLLLPLDSNLRGAQSMQYTKPMIELVYEIRRRVDANTKPKVKMANPDMLKELADFHYRAKDTITKTLIKELLFLAGEEWLALLNPPLLTEPIAPQKQAIKVYRGQTSLVESSHEAIVVNDAIHSELLASTATAAKPVRMYRGPPVD